MILDPVYREWWKKGPIVSASEQHKKDVELGFYTGVWVALGLLKRANKMSRQQAEQMFRDMCEETKAKIMPGVQPKFTASIDGQRIDPTKN